MEQAEHWETPPNCSTAWACLPSLGWKLSLCNLLPSSSSQNCATPDFPCQNSKLKRKTQTPSQNNSKRKIPHSAPQPPTDPSCRSVI